MSRWEEDQYALLSDLGTWSLCPYGVQLLGVRSEHYGGVHVPLWSAPEFIRRSHICMDANGVGCLLLRAQNQD